MTLYTIKYDENGKPSRTKWRIVAFGSLDPHVYSINYYFVPVISMVELQFLVLMSVHHRRILRSGDVKQVFYQATLPVDKKYVPFPRLVVPILPPTHTGF